MDTEDAFAWDAIFRVKITVKEMVDGPEFYDQSLTRIAQSPAGGALLRGSGANRFSPGEPVSHGAAFSATGGITGSSDLFVTIAQLFDGAKYDDETFILPTVEAATDAAAVYLPNERVSMR